MNLHEVPLPEWIGRKSETEDIVTPRLVASYRAIFGDKLAPVGVDEAPLGLHWCLSPAISPMEALGADGHPAKNRDLPPVPLPRRMWAGGRVETIEPIMVGDTVRRLSAIKAISRKQGRTGPLWFVTVSHDYLTPRGLAISELHDIVYREPAKLDHTGSRSELPRPLAPDLETSDDWVVDATPTLLFRYSAITFNGHRIHYDLPYATGEEGYPGLVVHGPMQATFLLNLAARSIGRPPTRFDYRGITPAIAGSALLVGKGDGRNVVQTRGLDGTVHMEAHWTTEQAAYRICPT